MSNITLPSNLTRTELIYELTAPFDNIYQGSARRMLFVCSAGLLRSPTGAAVAVKKGHNARSCGSAEYALIPISVNLIHWAHVIYFVNEYNYLQAKDMFFGDTETTKMLVEKSKVLDIEDDFNYDDPSLVKIFEQIIP